MSKTIFISNRLPVTVSKDENLKKKPFIYDKSIGGLATGLKSYHEHSDSLWVGWPGMADDQLTNRDKFSIERTLRKNYKCIPVFLNESEIDAYYHGFCNKTIWPLFHYFSEKVEYETKNWEAYVDVNLKFFNSFESLIEEDDIIWVHDYQLMLLPQMIKDKYPNTKVGFFLHIPFPSYEIFRQLIWREELLEGVLGSDLIGFHTYDYVRHFLSSTRRLLGHEHHLNKISYEDRYIAVDAFPMGIDYDFFHNYKDDKNLGVESKTNEVSDLKTILSIDRLDYTKGIPQRIKAYGHFLEDYPEYKEKVRLNLIVAPSRVEVDSYEGLRREITELVSEINGKYGTISWMPIWFFFQSFKQEDLIHLYREADVLLVTPLRDGMNLVAKEYVASRNDQNGMLVISETAGAASELSESIVVNANDTEAIARGLYLAITMPESEKNSINKIFHKRLKRYNVEFWAKEFITTLTSLHETQSVISQTISLEKRMDIIDKSYMQATKRIFFLDYDGTLVGFKPIPEQAKPDLELLELIKKLSSNPQNTVVIVSGRDRHTLNSWLGDLNVHLVASHGLWIKHIGKDWEITVLLDNSWKESVRHILEMYTDRMPGALIEEKEFSLAFHYRQCEPDMISMKLSEVKEALLSMTESMNLEIKEGNKVLEIKDNRVNKGHSVSSLFRYSDYDFIFAAGDDKTDEDLFVTLPEEAYSIKIGIGSTKAKYYLKSWKSMRNLLGLFDSDKN